MRDVNNGWLIRYLHANTASAFFFLVYLHIGRGLYYGSYRAPRTLVWAIGTVSAPKGRCAEGFTQNLFKMGLLRVEYHLLLPLSLLITRWIGIADNKSREWGTLLYLRLSASGIRNGQANELDTLKRHTPRRNTQNRFSQYSSGKLHSILRADGVTLIPLVTSLRFNRCKDLKRNGFIITTLLRDLTASNINPMLLRGRSLHTRGRAEKLLQDSKGDSLKQKIQDTKVLGVKTVSGKAPSVQKARKSDSFVTLVQKELLLCRDKQGIYSGIINILKKPEFLVACYEEIKGKPGNMTRGHIKGTLDGLSWSWFEKVGESLIKGKFEFSPARRVLIPKANGATRPLGINSPREKIIQKALAAILEQIWEPKFSSSSHGFRPNRSVHSALKSLYLEGGNYTWVIQGDITKCFDSIPHRIILDRIKKVIKCQRTLELISKSLQAGYIDPETGNLCQSDKGTPQGSVLSPLLCNIVLHELDKYMESLRNNFNKGDRRRPNPAYVKLNSRRRYIKDHFQRAKILMEMRRLRASDPMDPSFRRVKYVRYADDFIIMIIGTHSDAINIRNKVKSVLKEKCGLELNMEKTVISNIQKEGFKFLGADCSRADMVKNHVVKLKRNISIRATTRLRVFIDLNKVYKKLVANKLAKWDSNTPSIPRGTAHNALINYSHADIVNFYNSKIRGLYAFYSFAGNRKRLNLIIWVLHSSCALTLAKKYKLKTQGAIFSKFGEHLECPETGIKLFAPKTLRAVHDYKDNSARTHDLSFLDISWAAKLTESNISKVCVLCGSSHNIEMHHLRTVKDIKQKTRLGNASFSQWSGAFKRKQIPLCQYHHDQYHSGNLNFWDLKQISAFTK